MPSGNSTDYDSLPSPPNGTSHSAARPKKVYGRKAARLAHAQPPRDKDDGGKGQKKGAKRRRPVRQEGKASAESDSEDGGAVPENVGVKGREKREPKKGGQEKVRRTRGVEKRDVESNDETEAEASKKPLAKKAKNDKTSAQPRSSQSQPTQSRWRADQAFQDAENALVEKKQRKEKKKQVEVVVEIPARRPPRRSDIPSSTPTSVAIFSTSSTSRKPALLDKSNLTADSPRSAARPSQVSQTSRSPLRPTPSAASSKGRSSALDVFRDENATTNKPVSPQRTSTSTATTSAQNLRLPRAAGGLRLGSVPPPSTRPLPSPTFTSFDHRLTRSPRSAGNASSFRSLSPLRSAPLLNVPRAFQSSLPAPWALSAPAHQTSSSPHTQNPSANAPVFHFTTTEFGDLPSVRLSLGSNAEVGDGKEGGMDSTIVLETWEEAARQVPSESPMPVFEGKEGEGERTVLAVEVEVAEEAKAAVVGAREEQVPVAEGEQTEGAADLGDVTLTAGNHEVEEEQRDGERPTTETVVASPEQQNNLGNVMIEDGSSLDQHSVVSNEDEKPATRRSPRPLFWTSDFMPPRHPRPRLDPPLPNGPPSSEDELAYYLRTTGTYSSEDDLAPTEDAPSDMPAREDWLAQREIGRAIKPTSGQRAKRVKANEARRKPQRLRIHEGKRVGTKREILPLDQVKIPKRVRRLIEQQAYERGAEADDEQEEGAEEVEEGSVVDVEVE
ncbi:proteophosphoglycan ppg4 [Rhodotorula toruloides]|uniref:Proteophosphoglycan ppg4 n=1 Tax=Rhodotorula toruloides TaxID=5286 RepID=A0A511KDQ6_RHOTO|nr:proteophosphoglycan ppg4 [Rhodotorula toruloides]